MSKPATLRHGLISVIGRRRSMEDAFTVFPNLVHLAGNGEETTYDFFAVFDGHGSHKVSNKCKERLHNIVGEELTRIEGTVVNWQTVMGDSFARMDVELTEMDRGGSQSVAKAVGSTALVVVVIGKEDILVANCGDSRIVVFRDDVAVQLSRNHQPERAEETDRAEAAGGNVVYARLLEPVVQVCKRNDLDDFLVIGTNGLWDVIPNEMACDLVRKCFSGQVSKTVMEGVGGNCSAAAATLLAELAIARGSKDNISVIVVQLRNFDTDSSSFTA